MTGRRPGAGGAVTGLARLVRAALVLTLLACAGAVACGRESQPTLTVLGPWTGSEEEQFRELGDEFTSRSGIRIDYEGTTATREVLLASVEAGDPPDVAVLSGLGDLSDYARDGALTALRSEGLPPEGSYGPTWLATPRTVHGTYWVPVKADLKSIVWLRADEERDPAELAGHAAHWCVGMGSDTTTGWPGTDWIEDLLLQRSGARAYDAWATGRLAWTDPAVRDAWSTFKALLTGDTADGASRSVAERSLTTDYRGPEHGQGLLFGADRPCALEHQASFALSLYAGGAGSGDRSREARYVPSWEVLPGATGEERYQVVAGDFAGIFRNSDAAQKLLGFLSGRDGQELWADRTQAFSANRKVPNTTYEGPVRQSVARTLQQSSSLCLDASDLMPPVLRRVFHEKVLEFLSTRTPDPTEVLEAIQQVQDELPQDTPWLRYACGDLGSARPGLG